MLIHTSPLLEEHGDGGETDAAKHGLGLEERGDSNELKLDDGERRPVCEMREVLGHGALLEQRLSLDLSVLELNELVVLAKTAKAGESLAGFGFASVMFKPSRGEGHCRFRQ